MTIQGPGTGPERAARAGRATDTDDLDRAFGPDTASVALPSTRQRVRRGSVIGVSAVVVGVVLALVLATIIGSIQTGVGGVFPQPQAALDRLRTHVTDVPGVQGVQDRRSERRSFAGYDVTAVVIGSPDLTPDQQSAVVRAVSAAVDDVDGSGVRGGVEVRFGMLRVGVTRDPALSEQRLTLVRSLDTIGGVSGARSSWSVDGPSDEPDAERVEVVTTGRGRGLAAVMGVATERAHAVFPQAVVVSRTAF